MRLIKKYSTYIFLITTLLIVGTYKYDFISALIGVIFVILFGLVLGYILKKVLK